MHEDFINDFWDEEILYYKRQLINERESLSNMIMDTIVELRKHRCKRFLLNQQLKNIEQMELEIHNINVMKSNANKSETE